MWGWNRHAIALLYGYFILLLSNFNRYILLFWIFIFIFRNLIKIRKLFWITNLCLREMEGFHKKNIFLLSQNKLFFKLYCFIKLRFKLKSWNEIRLIWKLYHPEVTEEEYRSSQMDELVHYWGEPGTPTEFLSALFVKGEKEKNSEENLKDLRSLMDELD